VTSTAQRPPETRYLCDDVDLGDVLSGSTWRRISYPFEHIVADDVFKPDFYTAFEAQVRGLLGEFTRNMPTYDATSYVVTSVDEGPLAVLRSRAWHDMIARAIPVAATGDVNIALHHHDVGSLNGTVHNDLNPGWFVDEGRADGITMADPSRCGYWHGAGAVGPAYERVRAVAVLIYVGNDPWFPGDGGETGLYSAGNQPVDEPSLALPPLNNTLLAFECTPQSFHSFRTNRRTGRTSLIQWLHRSREEAVARWGEDSLVPW
jgi:hypothetical protein